MRIEQNEKLIVFPGGVGINKVHDPKQLDPSKKCVIALNVDNRIPGQWRKRIPIKKQTVTPAPDFATDVVAMFAWRDSEGNRFEILLLESGNALIKASGDADYTVLSSFLTAFATTAQLPGILKYRDKIFTFNGYDHLKYLTDKTTYGDRKSVV